MTSNSIHCSKVKVHNTVLRLVTPAANMNWTNQAFREVNMEVIYDLLKTEADRTILHSFLSLEPTCSLVKFDPCFVSVQV